MDVYLDDSVQDCVDSIANALELMQSCSQYMINTCIINP